MSDAHDETMGPFEPFDERTAEEALRECPSALPGTFLWYCPDHRVHGLAYSMTEAAEMAMTHHRAAMDYPLEDPDDVEDCGALIVEVPERDGVTTIYH